MTDEQPQNWRVHLHSGITDAEFSLHLELICNAQTTKRLNALTTSALNAASVDSGSTRQTDPTSVHTAITNPNASIIRHIFHVGDVRGYSGMFDKDIIDTISRHPVVQHVQPVGVTNIVSPRDQIDIGPCPESNLPRGIGCRQLGSRGHITPLWVKPGVRAY